MTNRYIFRRCFLLLSLWAVMGLGACRKLLEPPAPSADTNATTVFSSDAGAQTAMMGFYNQAMDNTQGILNGNVSLYAGLSADELGCVNPFLPQDSFYINQLTASNTLNNTLFSSGYTLIYSLNSILAGVHSSGKLSSGMRTQLQGETGFLRSVLYLYLVNLYGGIPLVTGTDYNVNAWLPRVSPDSVYVQLIADVLSAQQQLSTDYLTTAGYAGDRTRPVEASATALLARIYCYRQQWALAAQAAGAVIADPRYRLEASLDSVFMATSHEAIWQLQPVHDTMATADANLFLPVAFGPVKLPLYFLTPSLMGSFSAGDLRRAHWVDSVTVGSRVYYYPYKYKQQGFHAGHAEYEMVLRLAEQYLIRAEARAQLGDLAGALADVNVVRARAGLSPSTAAGTAAVLDAISAERRVELFTEWGHRWLDLKRWNEATTVLASKPGWRATDPLYPIPGYELLDNPNMTQNPGY